MFVRALWWGGPSFEGFVLNPALAETCAGNHFWLADSIGTGTPTSEDLNCDGKVDLGRAPKVTMDPFVVQGGLEQQAEQTFRQWRQNLGIVRVCAEKHLSQRIGTMLDERLTVYISEKGRIAEITFQDNKHADMVECMKEYLAEKSPFSTAPQVSELSFNLRILLGNSDYQIATCDHLRSKK
jgi:hypothetical protein